jgi:hypothetical protein
MGILVPGVQGLGVIGFGVLAGSWEAEERQARAGFRLTQRSVGANWVTGQAEQPDREVAQGGHDLGPEAVRMRAGVFGEGDVADPVERFDLPVGAGQGTELLRAGVVSGLAAERVDEPDARVAAGQVGGVPLHDDDLLGMRVVRVGWDRRGLVGWGIPPRPPRCATST